MDRNAPMWKDGIVHDQRPPLEGEYLPPEPPRPAAPNIKGLRGAGAAAVGIGVLLAKFKGLLLVLLNFKFALIGLKLFASAGTFVLSLWFYSLFFGWPFALVFLLQIFIHEMGHVTLMRAYGVPASLPFFIPGFGAFVNMQGRPASALQEAWIGLAGPLAGSAAATLCLLYGAVSGHAFWTAAAYTGFFLNLFNMIPLVPLDGGRVAGAISPRIWLLGLAVMITAAFAFHWSVLSNPLIFILLLLSIPQVIAAWRGQIDPTYYHLSVAERATVMLAYFALTGYLLVAMLASRVAIPR